MKNRKIIYLPIEIKNREFYSKLLFSSQAIKHGFTIIIGPKETINRLVIFKNDKSGIYFNKAGFKDSNLAKIEKKVDFITVQDEEIGPSFDLNKFSLRLSKFNQEIIDFYFSYDQRVSDLAKEKYKFLPSKKIKNTGWIREEMWNLKLGYFVNKAKKLKSKYGKFFLFSSNYGLNAKRYNINKKYMNSEHWKEYSKSYSEKYSTYTEVIDFLKSIDFSNFPFKIIIRPHPADDIKIWKKIKSKNIKVIYSDSISPWLLASEGLLHTGCTSAIEANIYGVKNGFLKLQDYIPEHYLKSFDISEKISSIDDLYKFTNIDVQPFSKSVKRSTISSIINVFKTVETSSDKLPVLSFNYRLYSSIKSIILGNLFLIIEKMPFGKNRFVSRKLGSGLSVSNIRLFLDSLNVNYTIKSLTYDCHIIEEENI